MSNTFDVRAASEAWNALEAVTGALRPIRSDEDFSRLQELLDRLLDSRCEESPFAGLITLIGGLIEDYEERAFPEVHSTPAQLLELLMEENGLTQADLAHELGGQSVVSEVLRGKREINVKQARRLGARFGISPAAFVGDHQEKVSGALDQIQEVVVQIQYLAEAITQYEVEIQPETRSIITKFSDVSRRGDADTLRSNQNLRTVLQ